MPELFKIHKVFIVLITMLAISVPSVYVGANEQSNGDAKDSADEFRVEVPIRNEQNRSTEEVLKNKLLAEKLIKMGRARSQGCTRCHGRTGMQTLARSNGWEGSIADFVVTELTAFREGKRSHIVMSSIAEAMSEQDVALVAVWYQSVSDPTSQK